jgi:lipid II:glycine glycyltransferase (peptidoglycan interpeptide bridge formation enzyme)
MIIEVIQSPGQEWDAFAERYTGITFFRSVWGRVLEKGLGAKIYYCCFREKGEIVGGAPGIILKFWNLKLYYSSIYYGGYIGEKKYAELFYAELTRHLKAREVRADIAYITPALFDSVAPDHSEMRREKTAITVIDIGSKSVMEVESAFKRGVRQSLRKAEKVGLEFRVCCDKESMKQAFSLYKESMKRNRAIVKCPIEWFEAIYSLLIENKLADLCMVFHNGIAISSVIALYSDDSIQLLNNGSSTKSLHLRASDFLQHEIIKIGIAKQKKYIDFMHSPPEDKPLIQWKEKFGSRTEYRDSFTLVNSRLKYMCWNAAKKIYPIFSR